jgi:hypothetical protein
MIISRIIPHCLSSRMDKEKDYSGNPGITRFTKMNLKVSGLLVFKSVLSVIVAKFGPASIPNPYL